jgi:serine/threonine protein kinase
MIDEDENPKIIDFGLSKDTNLDEYIETNIVGSIMYMAPEIL